MYQGKEPLEELEEMVSRFERVRLGQGKEPQVLFS